MARLNFLLLSCFVRCTTAFLFLPGISPNEYHRNDSLPVYAHKLISPRSPIPHDYLQLRFCPPAPNHLTTAAHDVHTSFAALLQGERARLTPYRVHMLEDAKCVLACTAKVKKADVQLLARRIQRAYRIRFSIDDLPVVQRGGASRSKLGCAIGTVASKESVQVFNHLQFTVWYHAAPGPDTRYRVVGFDVLPKSIASASCASDVAPLRVSTNKVSGKEIPFTYSVTFKASKTRWATRFDALLLALRSTSRMRWLSVVNSLMLALFLSASTAVVLLRTLRRDCARYGLPDDDDFDAGAGWRALRGDVFRPPPFAGLLCVLCGSGAQLALVALVTLLGALAGVLSPARRGSVLQGLLCAWALSAGVAGFVAARLHKAMGGTRWKHVTVGVAFLLPGVAFTVFSMLNAVMWSVRSIGAAPFVATALLLALWLGVSVPLAFLGTYFGYRRKAYDFAVRTNEIPRPIPSQPWLLRAPRVHAFCGLVPFGIVCLELRLILHSIWQSEFYHMFAFLFSVFVLLAIACAEVSVVLVFFKLSNADYSWWWDSWLACASSGVYVFLYSLYYLTTHSAGAAGGSLPARLLFVSYSLLGSLMFALLTGSIGFLASLAFTRRIYSSSVYD